MVRDPRDPGTKDLPGLTRKRATKPLSPPAAIKQGHIIGYARVSTDDQNLALQHDALSAAGAAEIYSEHASGKNRDRPELLNALRALRSGDTLLVWRMDRLGRSLVHLVQIVEELHKRGVGVRSLSDATFDTTTANGALVFGLFALLAEFERKLISERTTAGLKAARARGRRGGRPKALSASGERKLNAMLQDKSLTVTEIAETLKIGRTTLYNYRAKHAGRKRHD